MNVKFCFTSYQINTNEIPFLSIKISETFKNTPWKKTSPSLNCSQQHGSPGGLPDREYGKKGT